MSRRDLLLYLKDFGWSDVDIGAQLRRDAGPPQPASRAALKVAPGADPQTAGDLAEMALRLADCRRCRLCQGRSRVVFGVGNPRAKVVFVGEGPGAEEDRLGEPFVGSAGQLLNAMLRAIDLRREDVYIANVIKCRPPKNRDPEPGEAATCLPFLRRQLELIEPDVIVVLGRVAARYLLGFQGAINTYRGRWTTWEGRDVLPTFHPAYLLRNPGAKATSWVDFKLLRRRLRI
jgi:DNA polymerase